MKVDIEIINEIAAEAGRKILQIYQEADFEVEFKSDDSPLTSADKASHQVISEGLSQYYPDIPIMSEEGKSIPWDIRNDWSRFWLVDPLDGTKEFIKRNGEFTVNIALVEDGKPVLGVIYVPVLDILYFGIDGKGAFRKTKDEEPEQIFIRKHGKEPLVAVRSRSHASQEEEDYAQKVGCETIISAGSSLKFCRVAEGLAHYYYRHGPTMEWDTAAGHAIVSAAGGVLTGLNYNKQELRNGPFLVRCSAELPDIPLSN